MLICWCVATRFSAADVSYSDLRVPVAFSVAEFVSALNQFDS
jgi:hypothetical protein